MLTCCVVQIKCQMSLFHKQCLFETQKFLGVAIVVLITPQQFKSTPCAFFKKNTDNLLVLSISYGNSDI